MKNWGLFYQCPSVKAEFGRSMVEMLGVLAVVGVLSVIGLAGIRSALDSHKANTIVQAVNRRATVLSADKNFGTGFTPDSAFGRDTDYTIACASLNDNFFACTVADVQQAVCQKVLNLDWKMPASITPTTCTETNEMAFTFSKDLDGAMTQCADDTECTTPQATCTNGVCVDPVPKTCNLDTAEDPNNPCDDECQVCNPDTNKCEYACVRKQYLQSSGTQYIDTGFEAKSTTRMVIKGSVVDKTASYALIGTYGSTSRFQVLYSQTVTPAGLSIGYGNAPFNLGINDTNVRVYEIDGVNKKAYVDNVEVANFSSAAFTQSGENLWIFARSVAVNYGKDKIYYCKIWDNGTLVRDFIPVVYNPTNEACMYDKVSKELFCNQGSGSFTTNKNEQ